MDGKRFDDLSRRLSRVTTRRGALKAALAVIFAGAGGAVTTERVGAVATIRRNMCRKPGAGCSRNVQ